MIKSLKPSSVDSTMLSAHVTATHWNRETMQLDVVRCSAFKFSNGRVVVETTHQPDDGGYHDQRHYDGAEKVVKTAILAANDNAIRMEYRNGRFYVNGPKKWILE